MIKLELKKLYKEFESPAFLKKEKKSILEDINLTLEDGDILGLLGKNGAGKTTLLKTVIGLIQPSSGQIIFNEKKRPLFGFINSNPRSFFWRITSRENLIFFSKMLGLNRSETLDSIEHVSSILRLESMLDKPFMLLSSGQMQSMNIARSLLKKPDFLMLDEPTTSLDNESSADLIEILRSYLDENKVPSIWCSHDYFELNKVCNKFGFKDKKFIYRADKIYKFHEQGVNYEFEVDRNDIDKINTKLNIMIIKRDELSCYFSPKDKNNSLNDVLTILNSLNIRIKSIEKSFRHFEDYVL